MAKKYPVKAAKTSFDIVEFLVDAQCAGVSELARELNLPKSTVYDHLHTLEQLNYLTNENGVYSVSTKFLEIGARRRNNMELYATALPEIENLAHETGNHANLMIEENGLGVLLYLSTHDKSIHLDYAYDGMRSKLHMTSGGKAILAFTPRDCVNAILDCHGLTPLTKNTITDRDELFDELDVIRERKYAVDHEEAIVGMRGISAPILDIHDTVLGAISLYFPVNKVTEEEFIESYPDLIRRTANIVEININYSKTPEPTESMDE